jgi:hypothetical protein
MYTNNTHIPLPVAVWLASDKDYDIGTDPRIISATSLLKPIRMLVLERQLLQQADVDISLAIPAKMGTAIHKSAEDVWTDKKDREECFKNLGMPYLINKVVVNPEKPDTDKVNIYVEQRKEVDLGDFIVSGQFDFVVDGELHDIKSTRTYSYVKGDKASEYIMQGSIYRWLNPTIIKDNWIVINYIFVDWSPLAAMGERNKPIHEQTYPSSRALAKRYPLHSLEETERFIKTKLDELKTYQHLNQEDLPECGPKDLWAEEPRWAVYRNPHNRNKATRVLNTAAEAHSYNIEKCNGTGAVVERPGSVKRCGYCPAVEVCTQAEGLRRRGLLK